MICFIHPKTLDIHFLLNQLMARLKMLLGNSLSGWHSVNKITERVAKWKVGSDHNEQ